MRAYLIVALVLVALSVVTTETSAASLHGLAYRGAKSAAKHAARPDKAVKAAAKGMVKAVKHL